MDNLHSRVQRLKEHILEAMVEAAFQDHELGAWLPVDEPERLRFQAECKKCGQTVYASSQALYSILEPKCPGVSK